MRARTVATSVSLVLGALVAVPKASPPAAPATLTRGQLRWLGRVTFGIDAAIVARYRLLGRDRFLDEQLHPPAGDPPALAAAIAAIPVTQHSAKARLALWSLDAVLLVMAYTALMLWLPIPKSKLPVSGR